MTRLWQSGVVGAEVSLSVFGFIGLECVWPWRLAHRSARRAVLCMIPMPRAAASNLAGYSSESVFMRNTIDRYIFREISSTWLAVTVVLLVIMIANVLARTLSRVTDGSIAPEMLLALVGVKSINLLVTLIPLGLYLGVLLGFGRLYRDSEMSALAACGVGPAALYRPALIAGGIGVVLIALLTFWASPWSARYERVLTDRIAAASVTTFLTAGRFVEILDGTAVVFTEALSGDKQQFRRVLSLIHI